MSFGELTFGVKKSPLCINASAAESCGLQPLGGGMRAAADRITHESSHLQTNAFTWHFKKPKSGLCSTHLTFYTSSNDK